MKFEIKNTTIKDYLKRLSISVQSVSSRIEFTGILITVDNSSITFEGRNDWMDTRIVETNISNIKIIEPGKVLIKASMINEIVQGMEGEIITFAKVDSNIIVIKDNNSNYKMNLLDDEKYEKANFLLDMKEKINIPSRIFRDSIQKTIFAGDDFHVKFVYQGLNLKIENNKITSTVTDSKRVAFISLNINSDQKINKIIPLRVARELIKILPNVSEYKLSFNHSMGVIISNNMINQFSLIEGTFPNFSKFFEEKAYNKKLSIKKEILEKAINRVTIMNRSSEDARIEITIENNKFTIESKEIEIGSAKIEVENFNYDGDKIKFSISPRFLSSGLKKSESKKIELLMKSAQDIIILNSKDDNFKYLISPMI
ncbi:MAG: DNA polymerase III subunit beta [Candidatus Tyloplasma litorale]|nr:MAG: DNA polymerase III subunit beta [Mycoplasmatales bacterium]